MTFFSVFTQATYTHIYLAVKNYLLNISRSAFKKYLIKHKLQIVKKKYTTRCILIIIYPQLAKSF